MSETNRLVGTWKLKSFETRTSDGSVLYPWGRETVGYIIVSPDGYFCAAIMGANRKISVPRYEGRQLGRKSKRRRIVHFLLRSL